MYKGHSIGTQQNKLIINKKLFSKCYEEKDKPKKRKQLSSNIKYGILFRKKMCVQLILWKGRNIKHKKLFYKSYRAFIFIYSEGVLRLKHSR